MQNNQPKGITSVQAAQQWLDAQWEEQNTLQMDGLQRAHLRRMMGFNFRVKFAPNKIHVSSTDGTHLSTYCRIKPNDVTEHGQITNESTIDRLVDACARLKEKHDKVVSRDNASL